MTISGSRLSFNATVGPDCCLCNLVGRGGSQRSYGGDRTSRLWDALLGMGPRILPSVAMDGLWDPVGASDAMGGTAHPVCRTGGTQLLFVDVVGCGGSERFPFGFYSAN